MKIVTLQHYSNIWTAVDDDSYDGPPAPVGQGATEQEAINELLELIEDRDPVGAEEVRQYRQDNGPFGVGT